MRLKPQRKGPWSIFTLSLFVYFVAISFDQSGILSLAIVRIIFFCGENTISIVHYEEEMVFDKACHF